MAKKTKIGVANAIIAAFQDLIDDTGLEASIAKDCLERAIAKAYENKAFDVDGVMARCEINEAKGSINVYWQREVVEKIEHELDLPLMISLEEARKTNKNIQIGDIFETVVPFESFRREIVQSIKSLFIQNAAEAKKNQIYETFKEIEGTIVTGRVDKVEEGKYITINIGNKVSGYMSVKDSIPGEKYKRDDLIKVYIKEVSKDAKRPSIIQVSRSDARFLFKLFSKEIVEVENGDVYIRKIARLPGIRSKIAVSSKIEGLDAAGTCIGKNGSRIQKIVEQLNNGQEKIDVVQYYDDPLMMLKSALSPAKVEGIAVSEGPIVVSKFNKDSKQKENRTVIGKIATVIVSNETYSLAIGIKGQNAFLAQKLSSFDKLEIKRVDDAFGTISYKRMADIEEEYNRANNIVKEVVVDNSYEEENKYEYVKGAENTVNTVEEVTEEVVVKEEKKTEESKYVSRVAVPKAEHISVVEEKKVEEVKTEDTEDKGPSKKALKRAAEEEAAAKLEEAKKNFQPVYTEEELAAMDEEDKEAEEAENNYDEEDYDEYYDNY